MTARGKRGHDLGPSHTKQLSTSSDSSSLFSVSLPPLQTPLSFVQ